MNAKEASNGWRPLDLDELITRQLAAIKEHAEEPVIAHIELRQTLRFTGR